MARQKTQLHYITDAAARKASLKKRTQGLLQKVQELSLLCDLQKCDVVHSEDKIEQPVHWPEDRGEVDMVLQRFQARPEVEWRKKMVMEDDYVRQRTKKYKEQVKRLQSSNHEIGMVHLMQLIHIDGRTHREFTTSKLRRHIAILSEKVREFERKADMLIKALMLLLLLLLLVRLAESHRQILWQPPSTPADNFQGFVEMSRC